MILNDLAKNNQVYIACGYTDMRKSIDGLSALVQQNFQLDPFHPVSYTHLDVYKRQIQKCPIAFLSFVPFTKMCQFISHEI